MHLPATLSTLLFFLFYTTTLASPVEPDCISNGYATFYDDNACKKNPGIPVALSNSNCVSNEIGRNSIYIQGTCQPISNYHMVWSPGRQCNCQNECKVVPHQSTNGCWNLNGNRAAQSFRFINQGCGPNNCG